MIKHVNEKEFNKIKEKVLVDFYATWCGPCRMLGLVMDKCHEEIPIDIIKIDVDKESNLASKYNITSVPTLILFENGNEIKRISGFMNKDELIKWVDE